MYEIVTSRAAVSKALGRWRRLLAQKGDWITRTVSNPGYSDTYRVLWLRQFSFWAHIPGRTENRHFWCPYGYSTSAEPGLRVNITLEINPIIDGGRARGRILRDRAGRLFLAHRGGRGGGRGRQVTIDEFHARVRGIPAVEVQAPNGASESLFLLGEVSDPRTIAKVASYIRQAEMLAIEAQERAQSIALIDYMEGRAAVPPGSTETRAEIQARLGQGKFRKDVLKRWNGACAISGIATLALVRASHIIPWAECNTDDDRLNPANGLPLCPNFDVLFDAGFISFKNDGMMILSSKLSKSERKELGLPRRLLRPLKEDENRFMEFHRSKVFG
jgi:hypothetical protein